MRSSDEMNVKFEKIREKGGKGGEDKCEIFMTLER